MWPSVADQQARQWPVSSASLCLLMADLLLSALLPALLLCLLLPAVLRVLWRTGAKARTGLGSWRGGGGGGAAAEADLRVELEVGAPCCWALCVTAGCRLRFGSAKNVSSRNSFAISAAYMRKVAFIG